jgi:periplasmic protein TonB
MKHIIIAVALFFGKPVLISAQNFPPPPPPVSDSVEISKVFTKVEVEAEFPGGEAGWREYLMQNLQLKKVTRKIKLPKGEKQLKETIIVKFKVAKDGSISDVHAENADANPYCIAEAERVIQTSPKWVAAKQNGQPVNAYRRQPIIFLFER